MDNVKLTESSLGFSHADNQYVTVPDMGTINEFTFGVTAKKTADSAGETINQTLFSSLESVGINEVTLQWDASAGDLVLSGYDSSRTRYVSSLSVGYDDFNTDWNDFVVTYDGTALRVFMNGQEIGSANVNLNLDAMGDWVILRVLPEALRKLTLLEELLHQKR